MVMARASGGEVPLLLLFLLCTTAAPLAGALLEARGPVVLGSRPSLPPLRHRQPELQSKPRASSQPAYISGASLHQLRKARGPPALAASSASPQAAACPGGGCRILGVGHAVPVTRITNDDLSHVVDTNDEWIRTRTGIVARRVLRHGESLRDLSLRAAREAIASSRLQAKDLDLVLHASSSPDDLFGDGAWLAAEVQSEGDPAPPAFDVTAACSGFVIGLVTANMFLTAPQSPYRRALLVGSDGLSRWVDWSDRNTCILFGDAAGAAVLAAPGSAPPAPDGKPLGLLSYVIHSDGKEQKQITLPFKGTECSLPYTRTESGRLMLSRGCFSPMSMNGREVFKFVSRKVPGSLEGALSAAKLSAKDVDWLLLHQANKRIIDAVAERLDIPKERVLCNLEEYGNTSAASVPLCLSEAVRAGKVKPGDVIAVAGFGAGLTWAAAVLRYVLRGATAWKKTSGSQLLHSAAQCLPDDGSVLLVMAPSYGYSAARRASVLVAGSATSFNLKCGPRKLSKRKNEKILSLNSENACGKVVSFYRVEIAYRRKKSTSVFPRRTSSVRSQSACQHRIFNSRKDSSKKYKLPQPYVIPQMRIAATQKKVEESSKVFDSGRLDRSCSTKIFSGNFTVDAMAPELLRKVASKAAAWVSLCGSISLFRRSNASMRTTCQARLPQVACRTWLFARVEFVVPFLASRAE